MKNVLVTGAGGFIGGHLVARLREMGVENVRGVDRVPLDEWYQRFDDVDSRHGDLQELAVCQSACEGIDTVFNLAADMGGMGFIENNKALCMLSVLISTHMLEAARHAGVQRFFYSSSACVYAAGKQESPEVEPLRESDAYPAMPEDGYGWEKLFSERMARHFYEDFGLETRVARYHNVYGPCFDETTEVLTGRGWRKFADLDDDDTIMSLDPETGYMEFLRPVARQAYEYAGPMYRVASRSADQLVTPDHKLWCRTSYGPWGLRVASEIKWDMARLHFTSHGVWSGPSPAVWRLPGVKMSDGRQRQEHLPRDVDAKAWFELVGWYLAEGSSWITPSNHTVHISQTPGPKQDQIRSLLTTLGYHYTGLGKATIVSNKHLFTALQECGTGASNKRVPRAMLDCGPGLLEALFAGLMGGDGDADGGRYTTASSQLADDVQEIALRLGLRAWINHDGIYRVHLCPRTLTKTSRDNRWIEEYQGMVYDVTLPRNHVLMIRRNGKPSWSGNCGTYDGGREKAPAAVCRKVARAVLDGTNQIEIWGDGLQTRSFTYIDDCLEGTLRLTASDVREPLNIGSEQLVTINELVDIVEGIAGVTLKRNYNTSAPQGVRGRNSDNTLIRERLGWAPSITLEDGLQNTYKWIFDQMSEGATPITR